MATRKNSQKKRKKEATILVTIDTSTQVSENVSKEQLGFSQKSLSDQQKQKTKAKIKENSEDYEKNLERLQTVKRFIIAQQKKLDRRAKTTELVYEQLQEAYRTCCVAQNHLKVSQRHERTKG